MLFYQLITRVEIWRKYVRVKPGIHTEISCKETVVLTPVPNFNGQHSIVRFCFMGDNIVLFFRGSQMHMKFKAGESVVEQHKPLAVVCAVCELHNKNKTYILLYWW